MANTKKKEVQAPVEETEVAEVETAEVVKPNLFKAIAAGIKKHWKGFLIGAGAAAGAAALAYVKGRDSVIEALSYDDDELDEDDDDAIDADATEVEEADE